MYSYHIDLSVYTDIHPVMHNHITLNLGDSSVLPVPGGYPGPTGGNPAAPPTNMYPSPASVYPSAPSSIHSQE